MTSFQELKEQKRLNRKRKQTPKALAYKDKLSRRRPKGKSVRPEVELREAGYSVAKHFTVYAYKVDDKVIYGGQKGRVTNILKDGEVLEIHWYERGALRTLVRRKDVTRCPHTNK